jgi:hypothetical protein
MAKYVIEDTTLTALANSVRSADGSTEQMTPDEMAERVTELGAITKRLIARTITDDDIKNFPSNSVLGSRSFAYCTKLTKVRTPAFVTNTLPGGCFTQCTKLEAFDFGDWKPTWLDGDAFQNTKIVEMDVPSSVDRVNYTFTNMKSLQTVRFHGNKSLRIDGAFVYDNALKLVDFSDFTGAVPTVASDTFNATNGTFKILVPVSLIRAWKVAPNWAARASQIVCSLGDGYTVTISNDLQVNEGTEIYINGIAHPLRAGDVYNGVHCVGVEGTIGLGGYYQNEWNDVFSISQSSGDEPIWDNIILTYNYDFG